MKNKRILATIGILLASACPSFADQTAAPQHEFSLSVPEDPVDASAPTENAPPNHKGHAQDAKSDASAASPGGVPDKRIFPGFKPPAANAKKAKDGKDGGNEGASKEDVPNLPSTTVDESGQKAMPEITQRAVLSRSDVNRIVCSEPIKDIFYSKEKGVDVDFRGNSAFVKFLVKKSGDKLEYVVTPVDLTVLCGDATYTIIGFPKAVPAQTIHLDNGKVAKARENATIFREQAAKIKAISLIKRVYHDDIPDSFTITNLNNPISLFKDVQVVLRRIISVDGEGLIIKEFFVTPTGDGLELREADFARKEFTNRPFAICFSKLRPAKGEISRLFIVETKGAISEEGNHEF